MAVSIDLPPVWPNTELATVSVRNGDVTARPACNQQRSFDQDETTKLRPVPSQPASRDMWLDGSVFGDPQSRYRVVQLHLGVAERFELAPVLDINETARVCSFREICIPPFRAMLSTTTLFFSATSASVR